VSKTVSSGSFAAASRIRDSWRFVGALVSLTALPSHGTLSPRPGAASADDRKQSRASRLYSSARLSNDARVPVHTQYCSQNVGPQEIRSRLEFRHLPPVFRRHDHAADVAASSALVRD